MDILYRIAEFVSNKLYFLILEDKVTYPRTVGGGRKMARGYIHMSNRAYPQSPAKEYVPMLTYAQSTPCC